MTKLTLLILLFVSILGAQVDTGVIAGIVRDHDGARIPNAGVTILNAGTGYQAKVTTNGDGLYVSPPLPAGVYRVEVKQTGFRAAAKELRLSIGERPSIDFDLDLGSVMETVVVQAVAPVLQTETTTLS